MNMHEMIQKIITEILALPELSDSFTIKKIFDQYPAFEQTNVLPADKEKYTYLIAIKAQAVQGVLLATEIEELAPREQQYLELSERGAFLKQEREELTKKIDFGYEIITNKYKDFAFDVNGNRDVYPRITEPVEINPPKQGMDLLATQIKNILEHRAYLLGHLGDLELCFAKTTAIPIFITIHEIISNLNKQGFRCTLNPRQQWLQELQKQVAQLSKDIEGDERIVSQFNILQTAYAQHLSAVDINNQIVKLQQDIKTLAQEISQTKPQTIQEPEEQDTFTQKTFALKLLTQKRQELSSATSSLNLSAWTQWFTDKDYSTTIKTLEQEIMYLELCCDYYDNIMKVTQMQSQQDTWQKTEGIVDMQSGNPYIQESSASTAYLNIDSLKEKTIALIRQLPGVDISKEPSVMHEAEATDFYEYLLLHMNATVYKLEQKRAITQLLTALIAQFDMIVALYEQYQFELHENLPIEELKKISQEVISLEKQTEMIKKVRTHLAISDEFLILAKETAEQLKEREEINAELEFIPKLLAIEDERYSESLEEYMRIRRARLEVIKEDLSQRKFNLEHRAVIANEITPATSTELQSPPMQVIIRPSDNANEFEFKTNTAQKQSEMVADSVVDAPSTTQRPEETTTVSSASNLSTTQERDAAIAHSSTRNLNMPQKRDKAAPDSSTSSLSTTQKHDEATPHSSASGLSTTQKRDEATAHASMADPDTTQKQAKATPDSAIDDPSTTQKRAKATPDSAIDDPSTAQKRAKATPDSAIDDPSTTQKRAKATPGSAIDDPSTTQKQAKATPASAIDAPSTTQKRTEAIPKITTMPNLKEQAQLKQWHKTITTALKDHSEDLNNWYTALYTLVENAIQKTPYSFKYSQLIKDIAFEVEEKKSVNTLLAYQRLCPHPQQSIITLLDFKPDIPVIALAYQDKDIVEPLKEAYRHYQKLKEHHQMEAQLLLELIDRLQRLKEAKDTGIILEVPKITEDPRYEPLRRHRGFLKTWECIEDFFRLLIGTMCRREEHEYKNRPCFFKPRSITLLEQAEAQMRHDSTVCQQG